MWRFLLAGLVTVCGVILLFVASFGDPHTALRDVSAALPLVQTTSPPPPRVPVAGPEVAQASPTTPAPVASTGPDTAALQHQRDDLQQQLQALQAKVAQQTQTMASLRGQADIARHDLDTLRQQHAADQSTSDQTKQAERQALEASQQRAAEAEKQAATARAALDQLKAEAERQKQLTAAQQIVKLAPASPNVPPGGAAKVAAIASPTTNSAPAPASARSDPDLPDAVLNRLRRDSRTPNQQQDAARLSAPPGEPVAAPQGSLPVAAPQGPLYDARTALTAGRLDEARQTLEQAQIQLASRPVGPYDAASASNSVAAGQVAEALSMLGAGDIPRAMQYIDLAIAQHSRAAELHMARQASSSRDGVPAPNNGTATDHQVQPDHATAMNVQEP
jgi:hypothetical protein